MEEGEYLEEVFEAMGDETLIQIQLTNPKGLKDICMLYSLDYQLKIESDEDSSNRGDLH